MLESQVLLLRAWVAEPLPPGGRAGRRSVRTRSIVEPAMGASLGRALWHAPPHRGLGWLWPGAVSVHETEDDSLLFSMRRSWGLGTRWEVQDAEERPLGALHKHVVWDRYSCLALLVRDLAPTIAFFRSPQGRELAALTDDAEGRRLTFGPCVEGDPFARMLLLGAALLEP